MKPKAFSHIIWDWNGTLFDDSHLCIDVINEMLLARGKPIINARRYEECLDFPIRGYYERVGFDFSEETFETASIEFNTRYGLRYVECRLQTGAEHLLGVLRDEGYSQFVLSATEQNMLKHMVDSFPIRPFFKKLVGLDNHYAASKIETGMRLMEDLSCAPHEALIIGDTVHDYKVACAIGAQCILIPSGHQSREKLERCTGTKVLNSLDDIAHYII